MQETQEKQVWSLGQEDPLEEEMATHSLPGKPHWQWSLVGHSPRVTNSQIWLSDDMHALLDGNSASFIKTLRNMYTLWPSNSIPNNLSCKNAQYGTSEKASQKKSICGVQ